MSDSDPAGVQQSFKCSYCGRRYRNRAELNSHITRSHRNLQSGEAEQLEDARAHFIPPQTELPQSIDAAVQQSQVAPDQFDLGADAITWTESMHDLDDGPLDAGVADEVAAFYDEFNDESVPLYPERIVLEPRYEDLKNSCKEIIGFSLEKQFNAGQQGDLWGFVDKLEKDIPEGHRHVTQTFPTSNQFVHYVDTVRKRTVQREGWRRVRIHTDSGVNDTGVFRPPLDLLLDEIEKAGGIGELRGFEEVVQPEDGRRVYSAPWDSNALRDCERQLRAEGREDCKLVQLDVYCDGTALAKSGSQSAHTLRVRFGNLGKRSREWHEIGIAPCLKPREDGRVRKKGEARQERMQLFQRFLYAVFKDMIRASAVGHLRNGAIIIPRVVMVVSDQPQERQFFCLKGADSIRDCTHCIMQSRWKKWNRRPARRRNRKVMRTKKPAKRAMDSTSSDQSLSTRNSSDDSRSQDSEFQQNSTEDENGNSVLSIQLNAQKAEARRVSQTVLAQLCVARSKAGSENIPRSDAAASRRNLEEYSALPFPPALASFHGLGTKPFQLYSSSAFDKLHVVDLGLLRVIPDMACKRFGDHSRSGLPVTQTIQIANQRVLDISRSTRLPRIPLFRTSETELQSGMSGNVRREFAPFLWVFLIGLDRTLNPDDDELVQACLALSHAQELLIGVNKPAREMMKTSSDIEHIQKVSFEGGRLLASALNVRINTKIHRFMRHVSDHLYNFGCVRRGSTDTNEVMHKDTKMAYFVSNRRVTELGPQLLKARAKYGEEVAYQGNSDNVAPGAELLFRGDTTAANETLESNMDGLSNSETSDSNDDEKKVYVRSEFLLMKRIIHEVEDPATTSGAIQDMQESRGIRVWKQKKSVRFSARLSWAPGFRVRQVVYAGDSIYGFRNRKDALRYELRSLEQVGIIQSMFQFCNSGFCVAIVRRLQDIPPDPQNKNVVNKFGHKRFSYSFTTDGRLVLDCVPLKSFVRLAIVVPDMYDIGIRHGIDKRISELPDTHEERLKARFFEIMNYKFTSFPEQEC